MKSDTQKFVTIMKALTINAGAELTEDVLRLYRVALNDFTIDQIEKSAKRVLLTWRYNRMPPLAEIIDHIVGAPVSVEEKALNEANDVIAHINFCGSDVFPETDDPVTIYLMTNRWPYRNWSSHVLNSELTWWVKEFCAAYKAYDHRNQQTLIGELDPRVMELLEGIGR